MSDELKKAIDKFMSDTHNIHIVDKLYGFSEWCQGYADFLRERKPPENAKVQNWSYLAMSLETLALEASLLDGNF